MIPDYHSLIFWWFRMIIRWSFDDSRFSFIVRLMTLDYSSLIIWWHHWPKHKLQDEYFRCWRGSTQIDTCKCQHITEHKITRSQDQKAKLWNSKVFLNVEKLWNSEFFLNLESELFKFFISSSGCILVIRQNIIMLIRRGECQWNNTRIKSTLPQGDQKQPTNLIFLKGWWVLMFSGKNYYLGGTV